MRGESLKELIPLWVLSLAGPSSVADTLKNWVFRRVSASDDVIYQ